MRKLLVFIMILLVPAAMQAGNFGDFTVSGSGQEVTMGDSTDTLSFAVNNDPGSSKVIKTIFFNIDTSLYNFSAAQLAPTSCAGAWTYSLSTAWCALPGCVSFTSSTGIAAGTSCTFDIIISGPADGLILADTNDITTDTLSSVVASKDMGASQQSGDFTLQGSLPTWARRALAITLWAMPASVGVGDAIAVTMNVTNRSSIAQSGIVGIDVNPPEPCADFPDSVGAAVTCSAFVPVYGSSSLSTNPQPATVKNDVDDAQTNITVFDTAGYFSSGRILIDTELIDYTGISGSSFTPATRGIGGTAAAAHGKWDIVYSQDTSPFSLGVLESATITWVFEAGAPGTVYFTSKASNGPSTSKAATSNLVIIGDFTAALSIDTSSLINGQTVNVTMTVSNNGDVPLTNVQPAALSCPLCSPAPGGAVATYVSGPSPASISTLNVGQSGSFTWTYQITGGVGDVYNFSGSAASDTIGSNSHTSGTGSVTTYAVSVEPATVLTGAASFAAVWTVYNDGAVEVKKVQITIPPSATTPWAYQSDAPPADWTSYTIGTPVTDVAFESNPPVGTKGILVGQSKDFTITFGGVPQVLSDTAFNFPVAITDKNNNTVTIETSIVVTAYELILEVFDEDCSSAPPASKPANGMERYCLVATLRLGGVPAPNRLVDFVVTSGTGTLNAMAVLTGANGEAAVYLTAPCSLSDVTTTVEATYGVNASDSASMEFTAVSGAVLNYVPGSLNFNRSAPPPAGDISPVSIDTGDTGVFSLDLVNCGDANITVEAGSTLALRTGSPDTFALAGAVPINIGATATLTFPSGTIASGALQCYPILAAIASGYAGPFAAPSGDPITDTATVSGGTTCGSLGGVRILDWRELY